MNTGRDLILKINRPAYVPNPEIYVSSLAWNLAEEKLAGWVNSVGGGTNKIALIYETEMLARQPKNTEYVRTRPDLGEGGMAAWVSNLASCDIQFAKDAEDGAKSIIDSLRGVSIRKARRQAATPLSPNIALLQNLVGVFAKKSPTDLGMIIEQIFSLGNRELAVDPERELQNKDSASVLWLIAMRQRLEAEELLRQIDKSVGVSIMKHPLNLSGDQENSDFFPDVLMPAELLKSRISMDNRTSKIDLGSDTPFAWFQDAWINLTEEKWVTALPARRWVDWATTVLRMGFGFSYIWEANWCLSIANVITDPRTSVNVEEKCLYYSRTSAQPPEKVGLEFLKASPRLRNGVAMRWKDSSDSVTLRDVAPTLRETLSRGLRIRNILEKAIPLDTEKSIEETLFDLLNNSEVKDALRKAQQEPFLSQANSLWEAVKYSLMGRNQNGDSADFYGLLKSVRPKFTVIEPATEWIAVVSSLAINEPGGEGKLGTVRDALQRLGLQPSVSELTRYLESAGLANSAADADTAVSILSAF